MLSFVSNNIAKAVSVNTIQEEVNVLLDTARNDIALFEAVEEWLANELGTLPVIEEGEVSVKYQNSRGWVMYKQQSLSQSLWVIAMQQMQYHGAVNADLVAVASANWINDHVYQEFDDLGQKNYKKVTVTKDELLPTAKEVVAAMHHCNLINSELEKSKVRLLDGNIITVKAYQMSDELRTALNELIDSMRERVAMKCQPLQNKPMDWVDAKTGIADGANMKLVSGSKLRTKKVDKHVLDAVNKLQSVKFTVAPCILEAAKDMKLNGQLYKGDTLKGMFKLKELNAEAFDLYREIETLDGKEFYFPVTMDTRGRMYYRGGLLSPQGVDFCKAAFQFAGFKKLGRNGFKAICIHTANVLGFDKASIKNRIKFVQKNWAKLMEISSHMDVREAFKGADVFQALVAVKELQRLAQIDSDWADKESNLVCHQDGTCNGLQHMAAITGDRPTAIAVNCVASSQEDEPADIYGIVSEAAVKFAVDDSVAELIKKYGRDMAKNPVMVTGYGASDNTIITNTQEYLALKGEDVSMGKDVTEAYLGAIQSVAGAVTQLTDAISNRMTYAVKDGKRQFTWKAADGFIASTCYEEFEDVTIRVGQSLSVRMRGQGKQPIDQRKTVQAMSPNFVHSIDSCHLRMVVNAADYDLVAVHDSVGSSPCDYFTTSSLIREKYAMVHKCYDALADLCESIDESKPEFPVENDFCAKEALKSAYIFS
ncbi:MAG: putative RNA polymerase [Prokaryotic dsDNA virus sp.]|nr:MAG: putative RNA polymerase [Prokaryotic dsDNA virus sp.]|tara:strand:- start:14723 stop:16849 length:2127 start_codon:yes stop_codon:yes gene_type:complete